MLIVITVLLFIIAMGMFPHIVFPLLFVGWVLSLIAIMIIGAVVFFGGVDMPNHEMVGAIITGIGMGGLFLTFHTSNH